MAKVFQCDRCRQQDINPKSYRNKRGHDATIHMHKVAEVYDGDAPLCFELCTTCVEAFGRFMNPPQEAPSG